MKYVEFIAREPAERSELLKTLPHEVLEDLCDEKPYPGAALKDEPGRTYFEDPDILREYLREHHVPASKPWEADRIMEHEGAHAKCALALGAVAVRYYVLDEMHPETRNSVFVEHYSPEPIPNLAWAAIAMHPHSASASRTDMRHIKSYGYRSRAHVAERIERWNQQDNGLYIPEPEKNIKTYL